MSDAFQVSSSSSKTAVSHPTFVTIASQEDSDIAESTIDVAVELSPVVDFGPCGFLVQRRVPIDGSYYRANNGNPTAAAAAAAVKWEL